MKKMNYLAKIILQKIIFQCQTNFEKSCTNSLWNKGLAKNKIFIIVCIKYNVLDSEIRYIQIENLSYGFKILN